MLDTLIEGGTIVDGTGAAVKTADVGIKDGRVVEIGRITMAAKETLDAKGAWVTPGFVDLHTHYDGQASWDETFSPSIYHGVTTLLMGNCGVGFAPVRPGKENDLIKLMEGVEDIPGAALAEGIRWGWHSFSEYMNVLAAMPHSLDFLVQVPHDPVRMAVMGDRAFGGHAASDAEIAQMADIVREALRAGAAGFSTGRSDNHRTADGLETPASEATRAELEGIAKAFSGSGVLQMVSDFDLFRGPEHFEREFDLVETLARASGRPVSMTWLQRDPGGTQWQQIQSRVEAAVAKGLPLYMQAAPRGIGVINGLDATFHPLIGFPGYQEVAGLPLAERAAALREPERRARILSEQSVKVAKDGTAIPPLVDIMLSRIEMISARMFPLGATLDYEPSVKDSFYVRAKGRGIPALAAIYDYLTEGDGSNLIYFPIFNYNDGSLDVVRQMLGHDRTLFGLSDAGAHVGTVCDASFSTFLLTHWVRDRQRDTLSLEKAVEMLTGRNARYLGLTDRGTIEVGRRADLNIIDGARLSVGTPKLVRDLPAGGKRFVQRAKGYVATMVGGTVVQREGEISDARPGALVRLTSS